MKGKVLLMDRELFDKFGSGSLIWDLFLSLVKVIWFKCLVFIIYLGKCYRG